MSLPRSVADVIRRHVCLEVEGIDRMYLAASDSLAARRMDLLSAVLHELGHVAGLDHGAGVMAETLAPGARSLEALGALFAR